MNTPLPHFRPGSASVGRALRVAALTAALGAWAALCRAMPAAPPGVSETGAPSFVVMGPEALGLSTNPIDLHLMPDGRILVVSQAEISFGDGIRWEAYRSIEGEQPIFASVAVDDDGRIYAGAEGGFARIDLVSGAHWQLAPVVKLPQGPSSQGTTMTSVAQFPDQWYWFGGNGAIVSWRPGKPVRTVGNVSAVELIFTLGKDVFISNQSSGELFRLTAGGSAEPVRAAGTLVSNSVTCALPLGPDRLLVGTVSSGLKIFDGKEFRPFGPSGLLNDSHRITDLCSAGRDYFAASIDTVGIVFFDHEGNTVQVLDGTLDHRVARVRRLKYSSNGVLWALLNDGVARVEFPSPVSHYEAIIASGLAYAQPLRHGGKLWVLADGRAIQGIYDANGRLERFTDNTPPGRYLFTLTEVDGQLFAGNDEGVFLYEPKGWRLVVPGIVDARLGVARSLRGEVYYVGRNEFGVIQRNGQEYGVRRTPSPGLVDTYNCVVDSAGIGWLEMGASRVGRLDPNGGNPKLEIFGARDGLTSGWAEIYLLDGVARFHLDKDLYRFDDTTRRFVKDTAILARIPQLASAWGRPTTDSLGRLWYTVDGTPHAIDITRPGNPPVAIPAIGFAPTSFTAEDGGVVWMFDKGRLARLDPRLPMAPERPLQALITSVHFSASNRQVFSPGGALAPLEFSDNSLAIYFAAPANPFVWPVTFEVLLEGAGTQWVSTGAVGSATFYRLKEGDYVFHVRPVGEGAMPGREARLQFTVRPPWFRTTLAWTLYFVSTIVILALVIGLSYYLQRSKREELEQLVAQRTRQLNAMNTKLGRQIQETTEKSDALSVSEERYRLLNTMLEDRVRKRTAELSLSNEELQQRELLFRLIFEHAPVGISWKRIDLGNAYQINPTFRRILDLQGETLSDYSQLAAMVHPDDAPKQVEMNKRIESGETDRYALEERFVLGSRLVWARLSVAVIRDAKGSLIQEIGILQDITSRKVAEGELANAHKILLDASRHAGMAEVATGVLHNVGNVLNSVNVSATLVAEQVRHSKGANVAKLAALFEEHKLDLGEFLTKDPRGTMVPSYLRTLAEMLDDERKTLISELDQLHKNVEHIKDIVAMQQTYARKSGIMETVSVPDLIEDALRINAGSLARHDIDLVRDYTARPVVTTDKHKVMQILINLIRNAKYACDESGRRDKQIAVCTSCDETSVRISVADNGVGIPAENMTRVFNHGFTTREDGHGFGLHSGALAAKELGGSLTARSDGRDQGATFTLELPFKPVSHEHEKSRS